jgi:hypothetical protein
MMASWYVEYFCDNGDVAVAVATPSHRRLQRGQQAAADASAPSCWQCVYPNPADSSGAPCFKYQWVTINGSNALDVAITLTVQTQQIDPVTHAFQTGNKALLNVSPRNVFHLGDGWLAPSTACSPGRSSAAAMRTVGQVGRAGQAGRSGRWGQEATWVTWVGKRSFEQRTRHRPCLVLLRHPC